MDEEKKSTRRERFERYAVKRVQSILDNLDRLEKCSNKSNYEYYETDVKKIFKEISDKIDDVNNEFDKQLNKGKKKRFSL